MYLNSRIRIAPIERTQEDAAHRVRYRDRQTPAGWIRQILADQDQTAGLDQVDRVRPSRRADL